MSITIPPAVEDAVAQALVEDSLWAGTWDAMSEVERSIFRARARVAIRTMLKAWPGMIQGPEGLFRGRIFPLTVTPDE
jgi:hypothetical protein